MSTPAPPRRKRSYSDKEKAVALAMVEAAGGNIARAAAHTGIPERTLNGWTRGDGVHPEVVEIRDGKKRDLADAFEAICVKALGLTSTGLDELQAALETAPDEKIAEIVRTAVGAAKVSGEMMQLLRGDPTQITGKASTGGLEMYRRKAQADTEDANVIREDR